MIKDKSIQDSISGLMGNPEVKKILEEINIVCMNSNQDIKKGMPNLFLIAKPGSGVNYIAEIYAEIVRLNRVFPQRCSRGMLELDYHPSMSNEEFRRFVLRVKKFADTQNCYYGTTLIHVETNKEEENFLQSEVEWLLEFVMSNRDNMKFVIHIMTTLKNSEKVLYKLGQNIPYRTIHIDYLSVQEWMEYIKDSLGKSGLEFTKRGYVSLCNIITELIERKYFRGYTTINQLLSVICYECAVRKYDKAITDKQVMSLKEVLLKEEIIEKKRTMGFM